VPSFQIEIAADTEDARTMIECGDFRGNQATIDAHRAAMEHLAVAAGTSGVDRPFPDLVLDIFGARRPLRLCLTRRRTSPRVAGRSRRSA